MCKWDGAWKTVSCSRNGINGSGAPTRRGFFLYFFALLSFFFFILHMFSLLVFLEILNTCFFFLIIVCIYVFLMVGLKISRRIYIEIDWIKATKAVSPSHLDEPCLEEDWPTWPSRPIRRWLPQQWSLIVLRLFLSSHNLSPEVHNIQSQAWHLTPLQLRFWKRIVILIPETGFSLLGPGSDMLRRRWDLWFAPVLASL